MEGNFVGSSIWIYNQTLTFQYILCDFFPYYERNRFLSYGDDNMQYVTAKNLDDAIKSLEEDSIELLQ